jgi:hypothetical protein
VNPCLPAQTGPRAGRQVRNLRHFSLPLSPRLTAFAVKQFLKYICVNPRNLRQHSLPPSPRLPAFAVKRFYEINLR